MVYIIGSGPIEMIGNIIDSIEKDKEIFRNNRDQMALDSCRLILGEIQRDPNKDISDENVTKILISLRKMTLKNPKPDVLLLQMIDTYIPPPLSDQEVAEWFTSAYTAEFIKSQGKAAYRLIGEAKKYYGDKEFNSDIIKTIIDGILNEESDS